MSISAYLTKINQRYVTNMAREHAYRTDLEALLQSLAPKDCQIINEPANVTQCGNPDFVMSKNNIPFGFVEAKDIGKDLDHKLYKEQFDRYKNALDNLIITDYLEFRFYQKGVLVEKIPIAALEDKKIVAKPENFEMLEQKIADFCLYRSQSIKSAAVLAKMMAAKAKLLAIILEKAVLSDEESNENTELHDLMNALKSLLINDLNPQSFADLYAQTLAYGMFAARLHDTTPDTFTRQEAASLIPKTNPFLRKLFGSIAGIDIDDRLKTTVDNLAEVFRAADVKHILTSIGKNSAQHDPIIHFYETFLTEYNPALRKSRGVWYTPKPVVSFMVRAVDDILKTHFGLSEGLADTSKTTIKTMQRVLVNKKEKRFEDKLVEKEVHRVQLLDPATGTGTFLAEVIRYIYQNNFEGMQGIWNNYVENDLIPRLNGFELMMASYAIAHLKLDLLLAETGYISQDANKNQRFKVFLTNSLEAEHPDTGSLFATWLAAEAQEANLIKRDTPVMVVLGNPPYSVSSSNKSEWIEGLMQDYKKDLNERNIQPLSDDYIKFIRYGQNFVDRTGSGVLAYISNNSFIDGVIHRKMRQSLLESFDHIYVIDLHGSTKKKETAPDGSKDVNVFDIMQGVAISFFVKTGKKEKNALAEVKQIDLYGKREEKYDFLEQNTLASVGWEKLTLKAPEYFLVPKNFDDFPKYEKGFSLDFIFNEKSSGVKTHRDHLVIDANKLDLEKKINFFYNKEVDVEIMKKNLSLTDNLTWKSSLIRSKSEYKPELIKLIQYRPFDNRFIYFDVNIVERHRSEIMKNFIEKENLGLVVCKQQSTFDFQHCFLTNLMTDNNSISLQSKESSYFMPLYIYLEGQDLLAGEQSRQPNFNKDIVATIAKKLKLAFTPEKEATIGTFAPIDLLDYIYAVLHSPHYRDTYKEFLKTDFPRVPYPKNADNFWQLVALGSKIRQLHLLQSDSLNKSPVTYPSAGNNTISRKIVQKDWHLLENSSDTGRIYINDEQYFDNIPVVAWQFYIGGYQPAQKWLKDRTGRTLTTADIQHYRKMIAAMLQTSEIMQQIDDVLTL